MQKHQVLDAFVPTQSLNGFVLVRNLPTIHISKILCKRVDLAGECAFTIYSLSLEMVHLRSYLICTIV